MSIPNAQSPAAYAAGLLSVSKKWLGHFFEFLQGAGGEPPLPYCAPAPGRLYAEKQRKYGRPGPVPGRPYCAPAPGNRTKAGCVHPGKESMAVRTPDFPDLFRAPGGDPVPGPSYFLCPGKHNRPFWGTLPGLQTGSYRVMVYHTRSSGAPGASPPETGTGVEALHRRHAA